jgi:hypothetical protein
MAWVSEKERKPEHNKFVNTKIEPSNSKFEETILIYNEVVEKWIKPGTYDEVDFPPSHWWDDTIPEQDGKN